jgi:hypothetical protein
LLPLVLLVLLMLLWELFLPLPPSQFRRPRRCYLSSRLSFHLPPPPSPLLQL